MTPLATQMRRQGEQCGLHGSPLYAVVLDALADDYEAGGITAQVLAGQEQSPSGSVPPLRLMGALHRLALERRAPDWALHCPSLGGTAGLATAARAARDTLLAHARTLPGLVERPVQTNEPGRLAVLLGGLLHIAAQTGLPVDLLEIGASAGLNLQAERACLRAGQRVVGDPASPLVLTDPWRGPAPPQAPLQVIRRAGCDPAPLDPSVAADRLTLTSYVWADQVERVERLRAALALAAARPERVARAGGLAWLADRLAPTPGRVTVVWHSVVRQYLAPQDAAALPLAVARAGEQATPQAPLAYLTYEPERVGHGFAFHLRLRLWPSAPREVHLATGGGHGPPVTWHR